jgi:hypothetical protein
MRRDRQHARCGKTEAHPDDHTPCEWQVQFTESHYKILADGRSTGITRHIRTSGRPQYRKTIDHFQCGEDTFDALAAHGVGMMDWLYAHVTPGTSAGAR